MLVDFEEGYLTALALGYDIPRLVPEDEDDVIRIITDTDAVVEMIHQDERFREYEPKTFIFDSATALEQLLLGYPSRRDSNKRVIRVGKGIMAIDRNRQNERPSIEDYGDLSGKMVGFFNGVRQMPYHTVITAHAHIGEVEADNNRTLSEKSRTSSRNMGLPALTGKLQYRADNLADFFLHLSAERKGKEIEYVASTIPSGLWHSRTRIAGIIPHEIKDPTYEKLVSYYNNAIEEGEISEG